MAYPTSRQTLVSSSLLDRLMDDRPDLSSESQSEFLFDVARYKRAVARDLELLLNTRSTYMGEENLESFPLAKGSVLMFGISDLSSLSLLNPQDRVFLQDNLRKTIDCFEPRLANVKVSLEISRDTHHVMRFRVDALLRVHPTRPPVSFDAMLQLSSNTYQVKD
ncbi:type VI secretion system baseplate subunit TssE [Holophaga foetida]|uniref:type VI secretion system baseplate subunit TssE n=1 Tax=Holophaga foetida TaxID=35839 RepID=UPI0002472A6D|nr:type VI secretion system baseplate subunit TssE [Holophaga foetida]